MKIEEINITHGLNKYQTATLEENDKTIDYTTSKQLSYANIISILNGLNIASEFYDVNAITSSSTIGICAVALGKTLEDAVLKVMDSSPVDFINATIIATKEVDTDVAKMLKSSNIIVAPSYTKEAVELLEKREICYVTINTPLKDYRKYLSNEVKVTPLGTLTQGVNLSELSKDSFKVATKTKPTVEQIEDAVFAWKIAKHIKSQAIVIAKDLKTSAITQGLQSASVEFALDYSCDMSKEAILASDMPITVHDVNVAAQGRIGLIIIPEASKEIIDTANKYNIAIISTGITNILC